MSVRDGDATGGGNDGAMIHPMQSARVRARVAVMMAALIVLAWISVSTLGKSSGFFTERELPDVAGLPILVPQIQRVVPPRIGDPASPVLIPDLSPPAGATP
ncbi:MAG: hypothetical protein NVSMB57_00310 [Actinomycetota bacterium]